MAQVEQPRQDDPPAPSDAQLMAALASGQMSALGELVRRHQQRVRALAFRVTGRWDVADDVAQETFLRLVRSAGRYRPTAAFTTWLHRIVVNLCLDQAKRPRLASLPEGLEQAGADAPGRQMEQAERQQAIAAEVAALPERQRIALVLHRYENQTHAQIAEATGWSESAVESLLVRAYAQLRQRLKSWAER